MLIHALLLGPVIATGCNSSLPEGVMPDFVLEDVNLSSATYQQTVSPREKLDRVSAWYFGHST